MDEAMSRRVEREKERERERERERDREQEDVIGRAEGRRHGPLYKGGVSVSGVGLCPIAMDFQNRGCRDMASPG